jgi:hypothetical protein
MGLLNTLKSTLGMQNTSQPSEFSAAFDACLLEISSNSTFFYLLSFSKNSTYNSVIKKWDDEKKGAFIVFLITLQHTNFKGFRKGLKKESLDFQVANQMIPTLFKTKMKLSASTLVDIYTAYQQGITASGYDKEYLWPFAGYVKQIENSFPNSELPTSIREVLQDILNHDKKANSYFHKDRVKLEERIKAFLFQSDHGKNVIQPLFFVGEDGFKSLGNAILEQQKEANQKHWFALMHMAQKATGAKPSQKFLNEAKVVLDALGSDHFKKVCHAWFHQVIQLKESTVIITTEFDGRQHSYQTVEFLSSFNADMLKGFVWMLSWYYDEATITTVSKLAERCFKKIPQKGPAAPGLGNACLYTLYASKGLDGIAQLSRLRLKIKQSNTLALIEKYIAEAATKLGVTSTEIEDLAVDDFKLQNHELVYLFDNFKGIVSLVGMGKSVLKWMKPDGTEQKSVPQLVKDQFDAKLKRLKAIQKQIDQTTATQKERFDRMLRSERIMTLTYFQEKYLQHGLLSFVIQKVIFKFSNATESCLGIYLNQQWYTVDYDHIDIEKYEHVTLWHPVTSSTEEVKAWRNFLMEGQIQQPFKQAYREIYLLTDAEVNTRTYSNRMASHILKQHQYVTLAKGRNWKASLIGAWDGGEQDTAQLNLPEFNLYVEFWVSSLNADDQFNANGIWNYVTTDQIRFLDMETHELVELVNVPAIAFSEAMRDVDLFVGVASVGNDPTWSDSGGLPFYRDYWQSYSFGDLSEIAKNRKEILNGLVPRLKIASVAHIEDKFLIVKGKIRTYKIHIGSTNILMEPNDQYLCIVPDRSQKENSTNLFLPFEGDSGLSVIISKALLLANDDKITDTTITSQIHRA